MKLFVLYGQRKERYNGEYGLEALACMSEADDESNPMYLPTKLKDYQASGDFHSLAVVTLVLSEVLVRKILQPESTSVQASVIPQTAN